MAEHSKNAPPDEPARPLTQQGGSGALSLPEARARAEETLFSNQLLFTYPDNTITLGLSRSEKPGLQRFHYKKLPEKVALPFPELSHDDPFVWVSCPPADAEAELETDLTAHPAVASWYFQQQIKTLIAERFRLSGYDFVKGLQLWEEDKPDSAPGCIAFKIFTLRVLTEAGSNQGRLLINYDRVSQVLKTNLQKLMQQHNVNPDLVTRVIYNKQVHQYRYMPESWRRHLEALYPVLNRDIAQALNISYPSFYEPYKLTRYYENIRHFINTYLQDTTLLEAMPINNQWHIWQDTKRIKGTDRALIFGEGEPGHDIINAMQQYGPATMVKSRNVRYFFIWREDHRSGKELLQDYVMGKKGFINLAQFGRLPLTHDESLDIEVNQSEDIISRVHEAIQNMQAPGEGTEYFAFYVSPYNQWDQNEAHRRIYHRVKEILLNRGIMSQTIDIERFRKGNSNVNLWIPNIGLAMVAKLGGVPWRLPAAKNDLVVGFGAYQLRDRKQGYVGSAFCFDNQGRFREMDCWPAGEAGDLHGRLAEAIQHYRKHMGKIERVIVHYYKKLKKKDLEKIDEMIDGMDADIPVIVVRLNNTFETDYLCFDPKHEKYLPADGTYIPLKDHSYLLYINENKNNNKVRAAPLPLRLSLQSNRAGLVADPGLVQELMEQVYAFSMLHWRSVKQPRTPVTIDYPRMMARIFPYFESYVMPSPGRNRPWFL